MSSTHARSLYAISTDERVNRGILDAQAREEEKVEIFSVGQDGRARLESRILRDDENNALLRYHRCFGCRDWNDTAIDALADSMVDTEEVVPGKVPAGYTYLAQFVIHDLTWMSLKEDNKQNRASPALDLDSVLGKSFNEGERKPDYKLRIGYTNGGWGNRPNPLPQDVPRKPHIPPRPLDDMPKGSPLIPDTRNEGFLQLAQIHVAMLHFYNAIAEKRELAADHRKINEVNLEFQQHVQSVVLFDLMEQLIDPKIYADVVGNNKRRAIHCAAITPTQPFRIPLEFAAAAARFGHPMVREQYNWNKDHQTVTLTSLITMSFQNAPSFSPFKKLGYDWAIDWKRFFDLTPIWDKRVGLPDCANPIAPRVAPTMGAIPPQIRARPAGSGDAMATPFSIARETLHRQVDFKMASAQQIIHKVNCKPNAMDIEPLSFDELAEGDTAADKVLRQHSELREHTPIWYYVLKEAQKRGGGDRLGPLGSRLVLETIHAAIEATGDRAISCEWKPTLPCIGEKFKMMDLIKFAYGDGAIST